jgi:choline dehydrogenase
VIVGGGAAGCLLAEKLSRSGAFSVAVLEAGRTDDLELVQEHDQWFIAANTPEIGWGLKTVPHFGLLLTCADCPRQLRRKAVSTGSRKAARWLKFA